MAFLLSFIPEIVEGVIALAEILGAPAAEAEGLAVLESAAAAGSAEEAEPLINRFVASSRQRAFARFRPGSEAPVTRFSPGGRIASTTTREGVGTGLAVGRAALSGLPKGAAAGLGVLGIKRATELALSNPQIRRKVSLTKRIDHFVRAADRQEIHSNLMRHAYTLSRRSKFRKRFGVRRRYAGRRKVWKRTGAGNWRVRANFRKSNNGRVARYKLRKYRFRPKTGAIKAYVDRTINFRFPLELHTYTAGVRNITTNDLITTTTQSYLNYFLTTTGWNTGAPNICGFANLTGVSTSSPTWQENERLILRFTKMAFSFAIAPDNMTSMKLYVVAMPLSKVFSTSPGNGMGATVPSLDTYINTNWGESFIESQMPKRLRPWREKLKVIASKTIWSRSTSFNMVNIGNQNYYVKNVSLSVKFGGRGNQGLGSVWRTDGSKFLSWMPADTGAFYPESNRLEPWIPVIFLRIRKGLKENLTTPGDNAIVQIKDTRLWTFFRRAERPGPTEGTGSTQQDILMPAAPPATRPP